MTDRSVGLVEWWMNGFGQAINPRRPAPHGAAQSRASFWLASDSFASG